MEDGYYIGTLNECKDYDETVTLSEGYFKGDNWSNPTKHPTENKYYIVKHFSYSSDKLKETQSLSSDWFILN